MLSRIIPSARSAAASVSRLQAVRCYGGTPAHWKTPRELAVLNKSTMDDLPVPQGSWQEAYKKKNARNNMMLAGALAVVIVTHFTLYQSGSVYLHTTPDLSEIKLKY